MDPAINDVDDRNIGLIKALARLRDELDVYCLLSANWDSINTRGIGRQFLAFVARSCVRLITLDICKVFEKEYKNGRARYALNSIDGILKSLKCGSASALDTEAVNRFVEKYACGYTEGGDLSEAVKHFMSQYSKDLDRFKEARDKWIAHSESNFTPNDLPSYDTMERLLAFAWDFYSVVSRAFVSVVPARLGDDRVVRVSLKRLLTELGIERIRTDMD